MRGSFPIARIDGSDLKMHVTFFLLLETAFTLTKRKRESPSLPLVFPHPQLSRTKSAWDKKVFNSGKIFSRLARPNAVNAATGAGHHVLRSLDGDAVAKNGVEDFHFSIA